MTDIHGKRMTRNTVFISGALIAQKALSFLYFTMIARVMGVEATGRYFLAVSFSLLFSVLADLGFAPFLVREAAKLREGITDQLRGILGAKAILFLITFCVMQAVAWLLSYPAITRELIFLASLNVLIESAHLTVYSVLRGLQRLEFESMGLVIGQVVTVAVGAVAVFVFRSPHLLITALIAGNTLNLLWALAFLRRFHIPLRFSFARPLLRAAFLSIIPFALAAIFTRVTSYFDSVLLSVLASEEAVGLYSVPFKVTTALQIIPLAFGASLLPGMSALARSDGIALARTYARSSLYLLYCALPIVFGIATLADRIIPEVFGAQYSGAIPAQRVLIFGLLFLFLNFPIGSYLVAVNRQRLHTTLIGILMAVSIALNLLLIPRLGIIGVAIASLSSNAVLFLLGFFFVARSLALPYDMLLHGAAKGLIAASAMSTTLLPLKESLSLALLVLIGAAVYAIVIVLTRAVTAHELRAMISSLGLFRPLAE